MKTKIVQSLAFVKADGEKKLGFTTFIASTNGVDRVDDILDQEGWRLDNFKANPIILWSHNREIPAIGKGSPRVVGEGADKHLEVDVEWDMEDPLGASIARKFQSGYLNACSVGFRPGRGLPRNQLPPDDPYYGAKGCWGMAYYENELSELSPCNVPCNAAALAQRTEGELAALVKSMGPDEDPAEDPTAADAPPTDAAPEDPAEEGTELEAIIAGVTAAFVAALAPLTAKIDALQVAVDGLGKKTDKNAADLSSIKADIEASGVLSLSETDTLDALEDALLKALAPPKKATSFDKLDADEIVRRLRS